MYLINLDYIKPLDAVEEHLDAHIAFLRSITRREILFVQEEKILESVASFYVNFQVRQS